MAEQATPAGSPQGWYQLHLAAVERELLQGGRPGPGWFDRRWASAAGEEYRLALRQLVRQLRRAGLLPEGYRLPDDPHGLREQWLDLKLAVGPKLAASPLWRLAWMLTGWLCRSTAGRRLVHRLERYCSSRSGGDG